jgi:hypothetical protein
MCALAKCTQRSAEATVFGRSVPWAAHRSDLMRLSVLEEQGGAYSDHDTFVLTSLSTLRHCPDAPVVAGLERFSRTVSKLNNGVLLAERAAPFLALWRRSYRDYRPREWDYNSCVRPFNLSRRHPGMVQLLRELGPLPRMRDRAATLAHARRSPLVHITGLFNAPWRQADMRRLGLLEHVRHTVLLAANASARRGELSALQERCVRELHVLERTAVPTVAPRHKAKRRGEP